MTTTGEIERLVCANGGQILSTPKPGHLTPFRLRCSRGHVWSTTYGHILRGAWCTACRTLERRQSCLEEFREIAKSRGGKLLSREYKNSITKLDFECRESHRWSAVPSSVKSGKWCGWCGHSRTLTISEVRANGRMRVSSF